MEVLSLRRKRAQQFKELRTGFMAQLYPSQPTNTFSDARDTRNQQTLLLSDLLGSFKRYAGNQQTAYDNGSVQTSPTSSANKLERQVERAMNQALGRSPGRGASNFLNALNAAFPRGGAIATAPVQAPMLPATPDSNGKVGELSSKQAALYRYASTIMMDGLKLLEGLQAYVPQADKERVDSLRSLIRTQIKALVEEFRWVDEPRSERVEAYLSALSDSVTEFGKQAFLNTPTLGVTLDDEQQNTNFELLKQYIQNVGTAWKSYYQSQKSGRSYSLSERLDRIHTLLPVVCQATIDFSNALESVGLSENERRSRASRFTVLAGLPIVIVDGTVSRSGNEATPRPLSSWLPDITVNDLIDWLERFSQQEAPSALDSVYGIDFVTDQADRLFWTIAPIVAHLKTTVPLKPASQSPLEQILSNERVAWALDNLLTQLNELANLAA